MELTATSRFLGSSPINRRFTPLVLVFFTLLGSVAIPGAAEVCDKINDPGCQGDFEYAALWRTRETTVAPREMGTWDAFQGYRTELADMQLFDLEVEEDCDGDKFYGGLWRAVPPMSGELYELEFGAATAPSPLLGGPGDKVPGDGGTSEPPTTEPPTWTPSDLPDFENLKTRQRRFGFELVDFEINADRNEIYGLFHPGENEHELELDIDFEDFEQRMNDQAVLGYGAVDVEVYELDGKPYLAILWRQGSGGQTVIFAGEYSGSFFDVAPVLFAFDLRPLDLEQFTNTSGDPTHTEFVGIWELNDDLDYYRSKTDWDGVLFQHSSIVLQDLTAIPARPVRQLWDMDARFQASPTNCQNPMPLDHNGPTGDEDL